MCFIIVDKSLDLRKQMFGPNSFEESNTMLKYLRFMLDLLREENDKM